MKKNILILLIGFSLLFFGNCNWVDPEINIDPNNPDDVSLNLLLPSVEVSLAYVLGGDFGRYATIWTQHHGGAERQHAGYDVYQLKESEVNNGWNTIYTDVLNDSKILIDKAKENNSPHFAGIGQVITAMTLGMLVDIFNDIPYSESFNPENFKPKYDSGADIYATAQGLLDAAIGNFEADNEGTAPGDEDFVFGGNIDNWKALAYSLKARLYLHLSEIDASAYANALSALDGAIASNAGNAMVGFGTAATEQSPWFQFEDQRGDVVMGSRFIELMNASDDPRRTVFATLNENGEYAGMVAGVPDNTAAVSRFGTFYASPDSPVSLMTYAETKFIEAEAALGTDSDRAATAFNEAVIASLASFGVSDPDWEAINAVEDGTSITLEKILTQKYIALYTQIEPFTDWRRKGIPALTPAVGTEKVATRYPYPRNERLYNGDNVPQGITVYDKVFWDQ